MEEDQTVWIVANAEKFYFMECSLDDQDMSSSKLVIIVYDNFDMKTKAKKGAFSYCMAVAGGAKSTNKNNFMNLIFVNSTISKYSLNRFNYGLE